MHILRTNNNLNPSLWFSVLQLILAKLCIFDQKHSIVKPAFLVNCTFKMSPCLCFPEQFEPIVNSHLVKLTSSQLLATSLILCSSIYSLVINFSKGGPCVDGLGDYANIKVYKLLPSFPSICSKQSPTRRDFM